MPPLATTCKEIHMAKMQLEPGEQVLKEGSVGYLKSKINMAPGGGFLTDRRFIHTNRARAMAAGGLLGALMMKGKVDVDVPLGSITAITRDTHGRNQSVLKIESAGGQEYRLVADFDEWFQAFGHALITYHGIKLVEYQPGRWTAERG